MKPLAYRFRGGAQWKACLFAQSDARADGDAFRIRPLAPFSSAPDTIVAEGAAAPAVTREGEIVWRDATGHLMKMFDDDLPRRLVAPAAMSRARRIVPAAHDLWVPSTDRQRLLAFDGETLSLHLETAVVAGQVVDIAGDGHEGVYALVGGDGHWHVVHVDCGGVMKEVVVLRGLSHPTGFVYLRSLERFVVIEDRLRRLGWYSQHDGRRTSWINVARFGDCLRATFLARAPSSRLVLAGRGSEGWRALILDAEGVLLQELAVAAAAGRPSRLLVTGVAADREAVYVATRSGIAGSTGGDLRRYRLADSVPEGSAAMEAMLVTPVLSAPETTDGLRWLRIEAKAELPAGTTVEISYAATDDADLIERMRAIANDERVPRADRARQLRLLGVWSEPMAFHGADPRAAERLYAVPLHDLRVDHLLVSVGLRAAPGSRLPTLRSLAILYPGRSLMDHLPALYRRDAEEPGDFLRQFVGLLDATSNELDERIASLGRNIDPRTATGPWLDYVARWLGLPWNDALAIAQKRCIVQHAAELARTRGTRNGLERLLECLMPAKSGLRRFRVVDATADHGIATVGGAACAGSALPAILAGFSGPAPDLNTRFVVGRTRLACTQGRDEDDAAHLVGRVRIDIAATDAERRTWTRWLAPLLADALPATVRPGLRWLWPGALGREDSDFLLESDDASVARLGDNTVMGTARLPDRDIPLSPFGPAIGGTLH